MSPTVHDLACKLARYMAGGDKGRPALGDVVYEATTEHRYAVTHKAQIWYDAQPPEYRATHRRPFYSSCGDLPHALWQAFGIISPFVNREPHYVVGQNITRIVGQSRTALAGEQYLAGDVLHIGTPGVNNDHVCVVLNHSNGLGGSIEIAEYGQPGSAVHVRQIVTQGGRPYIAHEGKIGRMVQHVAPLIDVLARAESKGQLGTANAALIAAAEAYYE